MNEIKVFDILKINVALSESQAEKVMAKMKFNSSNKLDFESVTDVTTAFFNRILDGFFEENKDFKFVKDNLKFSNYNESVTFAFGDAFSLFKERALKGAK